MITRNRKWEAQLDSRLDGHTRVGIDTSIFIYALERHPHYSDLARTILGRVESGVLEGVASTIALGEILVVPYRKREYALAHKKTALLGNFPSLEWTPASWLLCEHAARLRAEHDYGYADALHLATSIHRKASLFITNDRALRKAPYLEVLFIDDLVGPPVSQDSKDQDGLKRL